MALGFSRSPGAPFAIGTDVPSSGSLRRRDHGKLRVAHFVALSGPGGIWGPGSLNVAALAAAEINARGGIHGREIELSVHDAGGALDEIARTAVDAIDFDEADVIVGCHMSAVRVVLKKALAGRLPYIYTPIYEGGERIARYPCHRRDAATAGPPRHRLARRKEARPALVPDRQRLCMALALPSRRQTLHRRSGWTGRRRGFRHARRARSRRVL